MWGNQLARQWRILGAIESRKHGATVAEFAEQEGRHPRTSWHDLGTIQGTRKTNSRPQEGLSTSLTYMSTMSQKPHLGKK